MSRLQLQPAAAPVDSFLSPEVRAPSSNANQIGELAQALQGFNRNLSGVADQIFQDRRAKDLVNAQATQAKLRIQNMQDLKSAVDRGEIAAADNPYFMSFMEQLVGREEVRRTTQSIQQEIEQDPNLRFAEVGAIETHINERLAPLLEGKSTQTLGAMVGEVEGFRDKYLAAHADRRRQDRMVATEFGFNAEVGNAMRGLQSAVADGVLDDGDLKGVTDKLHNAIAVATASAVPPEALQGWLLNSIEAASAVYGSQQVFDQLLSSVSVGGQTLASTIDEKTRNTIKSRIESRVLQGENQAYLTQQRDLERSEKIGKSFVLQKYAEAVRSGTPFEFANFEVYVKDLPVEIRGDIISLIDSLDQRSDARLEEARKEFSGEAEAGFTFALASGNAGPEARVKVMHILEGLGLPGAEAVKRILQFEKYLDQDAESTPAALMDIYGKLSAGGLSYKQLSDAAFTYASSKQLSGRDFQEFLVRANSADRTSQAHLSLLRSSLEIVESDLKGWMLSGGESKFAVQTPNGWEITHEGNLGVQRAVAVMSQEFWGRVNRGEDPNVVVADLEAMATRTKTALMGSREAQAAPVEISPEVLQDPIELRKQVKWSATDNSLVFKTGGVAVPENTAVFSSTEDLEKNYVTSLYKMGITDASQGRMFLVTQGDLLEKSGHRGARLRAQVLGLKMVLPPEDFDLWQDEFKKNDARIKVLTTHIEQYKNSIARGKANGKTYFDLPDIWTTPFFFEPTGEYEWLRGKKLHGSVSEIEETIQGFENDLDEMYKTRASMLTGKQVMTPKKENK